MTWGEGSLFLATRKGVLVLGLPLIPASTPAPTVWAHDSGCAWAAAWLTLRDREFLGQREMLSRPDWSGQLHWRDRNSDKRSSHRPDLIGWANSRATLIEVELTGKSRGRLDAILKMYNPWVCSPEIRALMYICSDHVEMRRIEQAARRVGMSRGDLRLELLDTIKEQTIAAYQQQRGRQPAPAISGT